MRPARMAARPPNIGCGMRPRAMLALLTALLVAGEPLPWPGWPQPADLPLPAPAGWVAVPGALLALAEDGSVRRRLPLAPGAQAWTAAEGALVADDRGLHWIGADGESRPLPPLPSGVHPLGIAGGAAFFAREARVWRLEADGRLTSAELPEPPLAAPLAAAATTWWLTPWHLVWWDGGAAPVAHRHGLPAGRGWALAWAADGTPLVTAPDGRQWAVPPYRAGEDDERLGRPGARGRDAAASWRAALAAGDWDEAARLAVTPWQRAATAWYAGAPDPAAEGDLLPEDPAWLAVPADGWPHACAPWAGMLLPAVPARRAEPPLADAPRPWAAPPVAAVPGGIAVAERRWRLDDDGERVTLACEERGRLRWRRHAVSPAPLAAPAWSFAWQDGWLVLAEGDAWLWLVEGGTGRLHARLPARRLPLVPGCAWPLPGGRAVLLGPPGRDDHLAWLAPDREELEALPAPARWLLALPDGELWLALRDGRALAGRAPGAWRPLALPAALVAAERAHLAPGGIAADARLWPWR